MLPRSLSRVPRAWGHVAGALEAPVCVCGAMQLLGQQQARASASPWGARAASPPLLLLLHGSAPVRHFLGGLAAAEPSKVYHERRLLG